MTSQELKNSILQYAIQGKLVPQNPNDEPASELLKRITVEKEQLNLIKKIKTETCLSIINDDEKPYEIPESWVWCKLQDITINIHYGYTASSQETGNSKLLRITDIQNNFVTWENVPYCNVTKKEYDSYGLNNRDIMIARTGGTIGKTYIVRNLKEKSVFASYLIRAIPSIEVNEEYLKLFLESPFYWTQLKDKSMGTGQPNVNGQALKNLIISLPPLAEQQRIVEKIEELMPLVEQYGKAEAELKGLNKAFPEKIKKSVLQYAIQGKLVPQNPQNEPASVLLEKIKAEKQKLIREKKIKADKPLPAITEEEIPFEIPDSWVWVKLGEIGTYRKGPFGSSLTKSMFVPKGDNTIKVYEQKNAIYKNHLLGEYYIKREYFETKMKSFEVYPDDIIVSCAGTIGETYIIPEGIEKGIINQALMIMKISNQINVDYFLIYFDYILKKTAQVASNGSAIKNIPPFEVFKNLLLPLPPLAEQKLIVEKVEEVLRWCDKLK